MGKIKLTLASGGTIEKPLITAFKGTNGDYVALDNEMTGSAGYPIILVCKLENNKLVKITDQNEWTAVKDNLRNIIAGGEITYINVSNEINADDIFYIQLTLPVPSFDALKNNYKVPIDSNVGMETATIFDVNPQVNNNVGVSTPGEVVTNNNPSMGVTKEVNPNENETANMNTEVNAVPEVNPFVSVTIDTPVSPTQPNVASPDKPLEGSVTPVVNPTPNEVVTPKVEVQPSPMETPTPSVVDVEGEITPIEPIMNSTMNNGTSPTPSPVQGTQDRVVTPEVPTSTIPNLDINNDRFKEQKEAFMQACENMFDALVQKFEKELAKK